MTNSSDDNIFDFDFDFDLDDGPGEVNLDAPTNAEELGTEELGTEDRLELHGNEETEPVTEPSNNVPPVDPKLTDEEVDRIFGEMLEWDKVDEETLEAAESVIEAESIVASAEKEMEEVKTEANKVNDEILELEKKLTELKRKKSEYDSRLWDVRNELRRKERDVQEKKTIAKRSYHDALSAAEMDLLSDRLEQIAKQQPWWTGINDKRVMPHQWDAMRFMAAGKRVLLGDGMGLGKSLEAIGTLDITEAKRVLVLTPADISGNFVDEFNFWSRGWPAITIRGNTKVARRAVLSAMALLPKFVVVCNYEAWRRDHSLIEQFISTGFDTIICDEAHYLKETDTSVYRGVKEVTHAVNCCPYDRTTLAWQDDHCPKCNWKKGESWDHNSDRWEEAYWECRSIQRVIMMTGTFILNKPHDLYAPLSIIDPVGFYNKNEYLRQYALWDPDKRQFIFGPGGLNTLKRRLSGRFLSRTVADAGIVLPPQNPIIHNVELDEERYAKQIKVIEQINDYMEIVLDDNRRMSIAAIIAQITRLRQANVWPGGITFKEPELLPTGEPNPKAGQVIWAVGEEVQESVKLDKAAELIREYTAQGDRMVVFSQFSSALQELHARVNNSLNDDGGLISTVVFDGSTSADLRTEIRQNFDRKNDEPKKWDVVMANYKTGGMGLNLTAATHTIILDEEWNPSKAEQALARTNRIGQTETTFVHIIQIPGTIDDWMNEINNKKRDMLAGFTSTADDLRDELLSKLRSRKNNKDKEI